MLGGYCDDKGDSCRGSNRAWFSLPAFADDAFDAADQVCGAWLASGLITKCFYGYGRGHYYIDATINSDGYEAWRVCSQFAAGIAATTPQVSFGSFGYSRLTATDCLLRLVLTRRALTKEMRRSHAWTRVR